jgi:FlaG/FlaF family flagellin (archaellin)
MTDTKSGMALDPPTASPVLKTKVNITLDPTFPYTLDRADFSVNATNITNPEYFRQMNVIAVYDSEKIITVMFGGAYTGDYSV